MSLLGKLQWELSASYIRLIQVSFIPLYTHGVIYVVQLIGQDTALVSELVLDFGLGFF